MNCYFIRYSYTRKSLGMFDTKTQSEATAAIKTEQDLDTVGGLARFCEHELPALCGGDAATTTLLDWKRLVEWKRLGPVP